jgi:hypothetical protein
MRPFKPVASSKGKVRGDGDSDGNVGISELMPHCRENSLRKLPI